MRKLVSVVLLGVLLTGCATQSGWNGAAVGGGVGAVGGAVLDRHNGWRGAVVGGALGAVLGGFLGDQSEINAREAYEQGRYDGRHDRYHRPEPRRYYDNRCGCYGWYDRDGYFHPAR